MDWQAEARALVDDISEHVFSVKVLSENDSSETFIRFQIETLERHKLLVLMSAHGFIIADGEVDDLHKVGTRDSRVDGEESTKVYETINALLDDISPKYRESFAKALINKMRSLRN